MAENDIDYQHILWDNGKPYWVHTDTGKKVYLPPAVAAQSGDPRAVEWASRQGYTISRDPNDPNTITGVENNVLPAASLFHQQGQWNPDTGEVDTPINWNNIADIAIGAGFGGGAIAGAAGGGGAASGGASAAGSGAPAASGGSLASLGGAPAASGTVAGGGAATSALGPTSAASMAGTDAAVAGSTVPAGVGGAGALPTIAGAGGGGTTMGIVNGLTGGNPYGALLNAGLGYLQQRQSQNAIQTASQQQLDAANRALDIQQQQYNTSRGDYLENQAYTRQQITGLAPYQQLGSSSLGNLARLTGQSAPANIGGPGIAGQPPPSLATQIRPGQDAVTAPNGYTLSGLATAPVGPGSSAPPPQTSRQIGTMGAPQGAMVQLRAPDGTTKAVPADQVDHYTQRGATRVG